MPSMARVRTLLLLALVLILLADAWRAAQLVALMLRYRT